MSALKDFLESKRMEMSEIHSDHECKHEKLETRVYKTANGGIQYRNQCLICGEAVGNAISKYVALVNTDCKPKDFDYELRERSRKSYQEKIDFVREKFDRSAFLSAYSDYLSSEKWALLRKKVIQRCNNLCEGCMEAEVQEVHHKTYERVGQELLTDLYGYCTECHKAAHGGDE